MTAARKLPDGVRYLSAAEVAELLRVERVRVWPATRPRTPSEFRLWCPSGVYFVGPPSRGLIKIGVSREVERRVGDLRRSSPVPLALFGVLPGSAALERRLHQHFAPLRRHGEWFAGEPPLLEFVDWAAANFRNPYAERWQS